jgi:hypothetical protein
VTAARVKASRICERYVAYPVSLPVDKRLT